MLRRERTTSTISGRPLARAQLNHLHRWWRAANYLSVRQINLMDDPLLREPLLPEHVKPRLLGHWGTTALAAGLGHLGAGIDPAVNDSTAWDGDLTGTGATARVVVVTACEETEIAREVRAVLGTSSGSGADDGG